MIYHDLGQDSESDAVLSALIEQYGEGWAYNIAYVHAYRGDIDLAFEWLDKAVETKDGGLSEILSENCFQTSMTTRAGCPF